MGEHAAPASARAASDVDVVAQQRSAAREEWTADITQEPVDVGKAASDRVLRQATYIVQQGSRNVAATRPDASPYGTAIASNEALWLLWSGTTGVDRDGTKLDDARRLAMMMRADEILRPKLAKLRHPEDRTQLAIYEERFGARRDDLAGRLAKQDVDVAVAATRSDDDELERARLAVREAKSVLRRTLEDHAKYESLLSASQAQVDEYVGDWMETYPDLAEMPNKDMFKGRFSQGLTILDTWFNGVVGALELVSEQERLAAAAKRGLIPATATTLHLLEKIAQVTLVVTSASVVGVGAIALALGDKALAHGCLGTATKICAKGGDIIAVASMGRAALKLISAENFAETREATYDFISPTGVLIGMEAPLAIGVLLTRLVTEALVAKGADAHRAVVTSTVNAALDRVATSRKQIALDAREWIVARQLAEGRGRAAGAEGAIHDAAAREARIRRFDLIGLLESELGSLANGAIAESFMESAKHPGNIPAIKSRFGALHARAKALESREDVGDHEVEALAADTLAMLASVEEDGVAIAVGMVKGSSKNSIFDGAYSKL